MWRGGSIVGQVLALLALAACATRTLSDRDNIYSRGADQVVLCAENIDDLYHVTPGEITNAVARAHDDGTTLHLYTHDPGDTIAVSALDHLLAAATERGLAFVTYAELGTGGAPGSLALSFDDHSVASWTQIRPLLARYHARVTFFVSLFLELTDDERAALHQLAADGHDIEYHSTSHLNAEDYAAAHGVDAYVTDEILPALQAMRADGYAATEFAYPFGARTAATDAALTPYFAHLRAITSRCPR
jgi:polysaccharide deacetylase